VQGADTGSQTPVVLGQAHQDVLMNPVIRIVAAVAVFVAVFMAVQAVVFITARRRAPKAAIAQAKIVEAGLRSERPSPKERVRHFFADRGYSGTGGPIIVAGLLIYVATVLTLSVLGLGGVPGLIGSAVVIVVVLWSVTARMAAKRKAAFDRGLADALERIATQLRGGSGGITKALESAASNSPEPFGSELQGALNSASTNHDLLTSLTQLERRYPSRGFTLFIAALEMSARGGQLAPPLMQASKTLKRDFELTDEANAEVSQTRFEYYGIVAIIGFIAWMLVFGDETTASAFRTPAGFIALLGGCAWFGLGMFVVSQMLSRVGGSRSSGVRMRLPGSKPVVDASQQGGVGEEIL
jgi:Flp pilus assembly protein TadB